MSGRQQFPAIIGVVDSRDAAAAVTRLDTTRRAPEAGMLVGLLVGIFGPRR